MLDTSVGKGDLELVANKFGATISNTFSGTGVPGEPRVLEGMPAF